MREWERCEECDAVTGEDIHSVERKVNKIACEVTGHRWRKYPTEQVRVCRRCSLVETVCQDVGPRFDPEALRVAHREDLAMAMRLERARREVGAFWSRPLMSMESWRRFHLEPLQEGWLT